MASTTPIRLVVLGDTSDAQKALKDLDRQVENSGKSFANGALAKGGAALAGLGLGQTFKDIGLAGVNAAGDFQQTSIAFEGLLGSAESAGNFLGDLRDFAAKTPFEFPGLAAAAQQLLGVGFAADDVLPAMADIGGVAASLGVGSEGIDSVVRAMGQMKGKGKASAEELQQISEALPGFSSIQAIADGLGISVPEAFKKMQDGAISGDEGIRLILDGMAKFPGASEAMEKQSGTLNGQISTLKDTVRNTVIDFITPYLPAISSAVGKLGEVISGNAQPIFIGMAAAAVGLTIAIIAMSASFIAAVAVPLLVAAAIGVLVGGIVWAWQNVDWFRGAGEALWGFLKSAAGWIASAGVSAFNAFGGAVEWVTGKASAFIGFFRDLPSKMSAATSGLWDSVKEGFRSAINWIIDKWNNFGFSVPEINLGPLGKIGGQRIDFPDIPRFAAGGRYPVGTPFIAGEAGTELIVADRPGYVYNASQTRDLLGSTGNTYSPTYNIEINAADAADIEARLKRVLEEHDQELLRLLDMGVSAASKD